MLTIISTNGHAKGPPVIFKVPFNEFMLNDSVTREIPGINIYPCWMEEMKFLKKEKGRAN